MSASVAAPLDASFRSSSGFTSPHAGVVFQLAGRWTTTSSPGARATRYGDAVGVDGARRDAAAVAPTARYDEDDRATLHLPDGPHGKSSRRRRATRPNRPAPRDRVGQEGDAAPISGEHARVKRSKPTFTCTVAFARSAAEDLPARAGSDRRGVGVGVIRRASPRASATRTLFTSPRLRRCEVRPSSRWPRA